MSNIQINSNMFYKKGKNNNIKGRLPLSPLKSKNQSAHQHKI